MGIWHFARRRRLSVLRFFYNGGIRIKYDKGVKLLNRKGAGIGDCDINPTNEICANGYIVTNLRWNIRPERYNWFGVLCYCGFTLRRKVEFLYQGGKQTEQECEYREADFDGQIAKSSWTVLGI
jgi:hypothetical protein